MIHEHLELDPARTLRRAAAKLHRGSALPNPLVAALADLMAAEATRYDDEITRDRPECPACDSFPGCHHPEEDYHDGGQRGAGCDRVFNSDDDRCTCFDKALAVARALLSSEELS